MNGQSYSGSGGLSGGPQPSAPTLNGTLGAALGELQNASGLLGQIEERLTGPVPSQSGDKESAPLGAMDYAARINVLAQRLVARLNNVNVGL